MGIPSDARMGLLSRVFVVSLVGGPGVLLRACKRWRHRPCLRSQSATRLLPALFALLVGTCFVRSSDRIAGITISTVPDVM